MQEILLEPLDELRQIGSLHKGVPMGEGYGTVTARGYNPELTSIGLG